MFLGVKRTKVKGLGDTTNLMISTIRGHDVELTRGRRRPVGRRQLTLELPLAKVEGAGMTSVTQKELERARTNAVTMTTSWFNSELMKRRIRTTMRKWNTTMMSSWGIVNSGVLGP